MSVAHIHHKILGIRFGEYGLNLDHVAIARGYAERQGQSYHFELMLSPIDDGQWKGVNLGWLNEPHSVLNQKSFVQAILNTAARHLDIINMWPSEQLDGTARISLNERVIPAEVDKQVIVSYRPKILDMPSANWEHLWDHIERRAKYDDQFQVLGFDRETVIRVLPIIASLFPASWVQARYREAELTSMKDAFEPSCNGWFPAYHLARAAHGAICRDPGWNYIVEIALAVEMLQGFGGLDRLRRQLTKSTGTQHHLCLAADLHARRLLIGLEPSTGVGAASNDLLIGHEGREYQVEVKQFTSKNPSRRLSAEIQNKVRKLPVNPEHPVIFHVVLSEDGLFEPEKEEQFFNAVDALSQHLPETISAVVAGRRFVDSRGGRVKRDIARIAINPNSLRPVQREVIRFIFKENYSDMFFPLYGIGSLFVFGNGPTAR